MSQVRSRKTRLHLGIRGYVEAHVEHGIPVHIAGRCWRPESVDFCEDFSLEGGALASVPTCYPKGDVANPILHGGRKCCTSPATTSALPSAGLCSSLLRAPQIRQGAP